MNDIIPTVVGFIMIGVMIVFIIIGFIDKRRGL